MSSSKGEDGLSPEEWAALNRAIKARTRQEWRATTHRGIPDKMVMPFDLVGRAQKRGDKELPGLALIHEEFSRALGDELTRMSRMEGEVRAHPVDVLKFAEIQSTLSRPTAVMIADVAGLGTTCLLIVHPALLLYLLDVVLGGPGNEMPNTRILTERGFTATEQLVVRQLVGACDRAWRQAWADVTPSGLELVRAETDPRHAAILEPGDQIVHLLTEVQWGPVQGDVRIVLPLASLRAFEKRLARTAETATPKRDGRWQAALEGGLLEADAEVRVELGHAVLTVGALLSLEPGDILRLDREVDGETDVLIEDMPKLRGKPEELHGNMAVRIVSRLAPRATRSGSDD